MSIASSTGGSTTPAASSVQVKALITSPMSSARPGKVPSSHRRHTSTRDGAGPIRSGGRTGTAMWRVESQPARDGRQARLVCARK